MEGLSLAQFGGLHRAQVQYLIEDVDLLNQVAVGCCVIGLHVSFKVPGQRDAKFSGTFAGEFLQCPWNVVQSCSSAAKARRVFATRPRRDLVGTGLQKQTGH